MLNIVFKTGNEAFDGNDIFDESARILKKIAHDIEQGNTSGNCHDINGNKIGEWFLRRG